MRVTKITFIALSIFLLSAVTAAQPSLRSRTITKIGREKNRVATELMQLRKHRFAFFPRPAIDHDAGAFTHEPARDASAESLRRTGDERDLALQHSAAAEVCRARVHDGPVGL